VHETQSLFGGNLIALIGTILRTTDSAVALIPHAVQNGNDDRDPL